MRVSQARGGRGAPVAIKAGLEQFAILAQRAGLPGLLVGGPGGELVLISVFPKNGAFTHAEPTMRRGPQKKGNCKNLGLEPCSGCRSRTGCLLPTAKRSLSEVKTAGLSPPRKRLAAKPVASCLRAHFIRSVVALCVISCATAAGGVAIAAGRHPIEAGTESFLQQQARKKAIDRESRLIRAELELAQLATYVRSHLPFPFPA